MIEELNGLAEKLLRLAEFAGIVGALFAGGYFGARRQQARAMKPLVGDPPITSEIPLATELKTAIHRLGLLDERQTRTERDVSEIRDEVERIDRDLEDEKKIRRQHDEKLGQLTTRVFNVERRCGMNHRADSTGVPG